jgi:hypothetical protein
MTHDLQSTPADHEGFLENVGPAGVLNVAVHAHRVAAASPLLLLLARDTRRDKPPTTARLDAIVVLIA